MARWAPNPTQPIGLNEHIGRRLFDEPLLAGALDQPAYRGLDLRNFQETRDSEYSFDRLGRSSIEPAVRAYLEPRAHHAGTKFHRPKTFNGWAFVRARELVNAKRGNAIAIFPSAESGSGLDANEYHGHAARPASQSDYEFALHLRNLFTSYGDVELVERPTWQVWLWHWLRWLRTMLRV
jgi:hypothetical protein